MNLMLGCRDVARNVSRAQDEDFRGWARMATRLHLFLCPPCRAYARDIAALHRRIGSTKPDGLEQRLSTDVRQRVHDAIDNEDGTPS
ncbi:hypothetical protein [Acidiferrobacter sp.]|jgi:hypothetical protein|uniref:hypothetical protein n=1 Tax=Acidiferrobacter sp. TaxID=1872107 RepID=UPI002630892F|nr:hypothetical protein [Acidiferrobacter sp.]